MKNMLGLLGMKIGMTQIYEDARAIPVTVIQAGPCYVSQVKDKKIDGYNALQLAFLDKKEKRTSKPMLGHFKKGSLTPKRFVREFRVEKSSDFNLGQELKVETVFAQTSWVDVTGVTKGRGFTGVVKRWNKHRGPESHGSMLVRAPGSIGTNTSGSGTRKGHHLPGHYGMEQVTVKNLRLAKVIPEKNLLLVRGAVPGPNQRWVIITPSYKNPPVGK